MTIQIDDQGWGTPVGGVGIIIVRKETFEIYYDIIPIEYFNLEMFRKKVYLNGAKNIVFPFFVRKKWSNVQEVEREMPKRDISFSFSCESCGEKFNKIFSVVL